MTGLDEARSWREPDPGSPAALDWQLAEDEAIDAMRRLRQLTGQLDKVVARAEAEIAVVQSWADGEVARIRPRMELLEAALGALAVRLRRAGWGATLRLPHGDVATTSRGERWTVADEELLNVWTAGLGLGERVWRRAPLDQIKRAAARDGELPPGVELAPAEVTAKVKVDRSTPIDDGNAIG